jgi:hypothetical protein
MFFLGLLLLCASSLMYEVVLTRLLSVICWYYLAFVSVAMAMFGMTAGALAVHLRPSFFARDNLPRRLYQSVLAMAISMPVSLMLVLAIPPAITGVLESVISFLLFSSVIAVPFFFSGVGVCISVTRMQMPVGRVYFVDLVGATLGCVGAVGLLSLIDAPSAFFAISAILFVSAAAYAIHARLFRSSMHCLIAAAILVVVTLLNASTWRGIQPIWAKGQLDRRIDLVLEIWNPISKVRVHQSGTVPPHMWGPSAHMPPFQVQQMDMDIDNNASTAMLHFDGDLSKLSFLRYDVTSLGAEMRHGGTGAIIGVGGGRDVLNCAANGFKRIVGIEVNSAIVDVTTRRLGSYSGFSRIPGFELHTDEGRSYLTRSGEHFDLIQASLVDTWAATSAGAMSLTENTLYTVDGWRIFYEHLKPHGIITFSRWYAEGHYASETYRIVAVADAMLLSEGVSDPASHIVLIQSGPISTLLVSNEPFDARDLNFLQSIDSEMGFTPIMMPGKPIAAPDLRRIVLARTPQQMANFWDENSRNISPTYDSSPYFFNLVPFIELPRLLALPGEDASLQPNLFLLAFFLAAVVLVIATIVAPAWLTARQPVGLSSAPIGAFVYFISIGLGFMCVEMAMIQQLSIFLGQPIYAFVVVLAGLILSTGLGSLWSDRWPARSAWQCRLPVFAAALMVVLYLDFVLPVIHACTGLPLGLRALTCFLLISPSGLALGFCFPVGLRWMRGLAQQHNLPWMWAMNGAAGALGSFVAMLISMEFSIGTCLLVGAALYLLAAIAIPMRASDIVQVSAVDHA